MQLFDATTLGIDVLSELSIGWYFTNLLDSYGFPLIYRPDGTTPVNFINGFAWLDDVERKDVVKRSDFTDYRHQIPLPMVSYDFLSDYAESIELGNRKKKKTYDLSFIIGAENKAQVVNLANFLSTALNELLVPLSDYNINTKPTIGEIYFDDIATTRLYDVFSQPNLAKNYSLTVNCYAVVTVDDIFEEPTVEEPLAWIKWGNSPEFTEEWLDHASNFSMVALSPGVWENRQVEIDTIKQKNSDILLGTYFSMHTCAPWMEDADPASYPGQLWALLSANPIIDESGEPLSFYNNYPCYDFFDETVRRGAATILSQYLGDYGLNWVFCDFCSVPMPNWDGGTGFSEYQQSIMADTWLSYISDLRELLPKGVKLVVNGTWPQKDDTFASVIDGVWLENWPVWLSNLTEIIVGPRYIDGYGLVCLGNYGVNDWREEARELGPGAIAGFFQTGAEWPLYPWGEV